MSGEFDDLGDANYVMGYLSGAGDFDEFSSNLLKPIDDFYANYITSDGANMLANLTILAIFMQKCRKRWP